MNTNSLVSEDSVAIEVDIGMELRRFESLAKLQHKIPALSESDRQAIILALAKLAEQRVGWVNYLREIAQKFGGDEADELFENFCSNSDGQSNTCCFILPQMLVTAIRSSLTQLQNEEAIPKGPLATKEQLMKWQERHNLLLESIEPALQQLLERVNTQT